MNKNQILAVPDMSLTVPVAVPEANLTVPEGVLSVPVAVPVAVPDLGNRKEFG